MHYIIITSYIESFHVPVELLLKLPSQRCKDGLVTYLRAESGIQPIRERICRHLQQLTNLMEEGER